MLGELKGLVLLVLLASLAGVIRPFLAGTRRWHYVAAGLVSGVLVGALSGQGEVDGASGGAAVASVASSPATCEGGGRVTNREVAVTGEMALRLHAGEDAKRMINQKATEIMGDTQYQNVDQTARLSETCRQAEWSKVRFLGPEWLTHVEGWVPARALRTVTASKDGKRTYVAQDFYWDKDTKAYKAELVPVVNRLVRESSDCATVDTGTLAKSSQRSQPGKPVFFITCQGGNVHNVWFTDDGEWVN